MPKGAPHPADEALGRSQAAPTTKVQPGLRPAGPAAQRGDHLGAAARKHTSDSGPRWHPGAGRTVPQAPVARHRGQGLQLPGLPAAPTPAGHSAYEPRAARPAAAADDASGPTAHVRCSNIPSTQRCRAVRQQTQAVAGDRHEIREARRQLPGDGGHRCADDLVNVVDHRTPPRRKRRLPLCRRRDPPLPRLPPPAQAI
jgi:hypothetical protein